MAMMAEIKAFHGHRSMASSSKLTLLPLPPYLSVTETDTEPLIVHESLRPTSHLVALDYIRPPAPWKGQQFILNKVVIFSKYEFTFPTALTWSAPLLGFTEHLIH